jgi:DNA repair exonuclease SbcCD ATPase subunit
MKKHLGIIALLLSTTILMAENKTFVREYNYQASENDSKVSARAKALSEVKRLLLEELGIYMESYTNYTVEDKSGTITKDFFQNEIKSLSAGITETKILSENWNGVQYYVKAEIEADPTDVARKINATLEKRQADVVIDSLRILLSNTQTLSSQKNEEVKALQAKYETQISQLQQQKQKVNELKLQLQTLKTQLDTYQKQEQQILSEVQQIEQRIKKATDIVLENARLGMTRNELYKVCGEPRSTTLLGKYVNYGKIWIEMSSHEDHAIIVKGGYITDPHRLYSVNNIIKQ